MWQKVLLQPANHLQELGMADVKLRLKAGSREIEVEGSLADVTTLLAQWWKPAGGTDSADEDEGDRAGEGNGATGKVRAARPRKKAPRARPPAAPSGSATDANGIDTTVFANDVKSSPLFPKIEQKIILGNASNFQKFAFVQWFLKRPITSGDAQKALTALRMRIALPRLSEAISRNSTSLLTVNVGGKVKYELTSLAIADFEKWFNADAGT
jgi:hypothetical protein